MFEGEGQEWNDGEEQVWCKLISADPTDVYRRTGARFDEGASVYFLSVFNTTVAIYPENREIRGTGNLCNLLLRRLPHYSRISILWYLVKAQDIPLSGNFVNPRELNGGLVFAGGSHVLPLEKLAYGYCADTTAFMRKSEALGGEYHQYGDVSIMLHPFPRIPVLLVLWRKDEEFPPRAELLLDETSSQHLPTDILWSTAMLSILVML